MPVPGVEGGVICGDTKPGNSWFDWREDSWSESWGFSGADWGSWPNPGWVMCRELRSSSEMARETGIGRGE